MIRHLLFSVVLAFFFTSSAYAHPEPCAQEKVRLDTCKKTNSKGCVKEKQLLDRCVSFAYIINMPNKQNLRTSFFNCMGKFRDKGAFVKCIPNELLFQTENMGAIYEELLKKLPPNKLALLKQSQKAWADYKDTTCKLSKILTKTEQQQFLLCELGLTVHRIVELENILATVGFGYSF